MSKLPGTDRDTLVRKAYATEDAYMTRMRIHENYSAPKVNFVEWVLDRFAWRGDETVLDIGSGPGTYFEPLLKRIPRGQLYAADLSFGMVKKSADLNITKWLMNADVQALPFKRRSVDVVMANHVLFHIPNLDEAVSEIHRILKPTGVLIASTNSRETMPQMEQLMRYAFTLLGARQMDIESPRPYEFYLEDGAMRLGRHFFAVARYDLPTAFVFPSAAPAVDYINSTRALREDRLPPGINWDDFISVITSQIQRKINREGEWVVDKLSGVLIATDAGGFANDFVNKIIISKRRP